VVVSLIVVASLIRFVWATVFPLAGSLVDWLLHDGNLAAIGTKDAALVSLISGVLYGLKKYKWPNTKF